MKHGLTLSIRRTVDHLAKVLGNPRAKEEERGEGEMGKGEKGKGEQGETDAFRSHRLYEFRIGRGCDYVLPADCSLINSLRGTSRGNMKLSSLGVTEEVGEVSILKARS